MRTDVIDLHAFYRSDLGRTARRMIGGRLRRLWPDVHDARVLGVGYAAPYLGPFQAEAERVLAAMPALQGVMRWPEDAPGLTVLTGEADLPFPDRSMDRVLLVHGLEGTEQPRLLLREVWRVLADGGRLLAVVPNRRGIWARLERTPFGNGRPYSPAQLSHLLRDTLFMPLETAHALFVPPARRRVILAAAPAWERLGSRWFEPLAGVLLTEATKRMAAAPPLREAPAHPVPEGVWNGIRGVAPGCPSGAGTR